MICYSCKNEKEANELSDYELKSGGSVSVCLVCENTSEYYLDVIKRECLIDGVAYELTDDDIKQIRIESKMRKEVEEDERRQDEALSADQPIFFFTNEPLKKPEYDYQALKYMNGFLGNEEHEESHVQRFKFKDAVCKHWYVGDWDGLTNVNIYIDTINKDYQRVRKPGEKEWRNRTRKWYSGRFECDESFYNVTFGFSQVEDKPFGDVYVNYSFICSKGWKIGKLVEELRTELLE